MHEDPIVAETRKLRAEMMNEFGDDLDALFEHLKRREQMHPDRLVNFPPRRPLAIGAREK
jgi:hypothetical protein